MIKIQKTNPTAKMFKDYAQENQIYFDLPMQRGYVWTREKKSKLILSIIEGYPIPPLYANFKDKVYYIVDGQQRGKTIVSFQQNKFALSSLPHVVIGGNTYDISGKKFVQLPDEIQTMIEQFNMDLHYGENMSDKEQKEMFIRLNSGKPLSATEMTKAQIKSVSEIMDIANHSVFKKIINERGLEASKNSSLVMQAYVAIFEPYKCMLSSSIKNLLCGTDVTKDQQKHIKKCLDVFESIYDKVSAEKSDISKKLSLVLKRKSHFISFLYIISKHLELQEADIDMLANWVKQFFDSDVDKTTISEEYNKTLKDAMNSDESVNQRFGAMLTNFNQYTNSSKE